ncbi:uncharacterized protein BDCG_07300 [Blastomyces dermatitidis ER-3]|uniref:Uncharacterized protein n=2 Tax=Blastomyces TaxID=229219 RepID=A0A179UX45_BLAGS|nr:uncharacterized protein BDBG_07113 [Blastomyces gilchristii SLH14081]XP_045278567.1 uncharacterized protein BDCG_07300 [Blastomyces dermatitidis ER-3]EEQ92180.1 hypothetical protein BDCG_07300 [Blastomyces dermatitidis ER-3]OAT11667.1 hypothetical protein BDBG_07113 [Blastomyces gilchristii SLH14081]
MSQRNPDSNSGLETNYAEGMPGGNAEYVPTTPQGPESRYLQPKWVAENEPFHEVHTKPPSPFRSRRLRIILVAAVALVCIGIGIGVGVAISRATKTGDSEGDAPASTKTSSTTTSPTATTAPNHLNVLAAVHGNGIVTPDAKQLVDAEGNIAFDSHPFPFTDNMFGYRKCFSLLHQLGSNGDEDMRIFHACEGTGFYKLEAGPISKSRNTELVPKYDDLEQDGFRIISIIWGAGELRERSVHEKVFKAGMNREMVTFTNEFFGQTSHPGPDGGIPPGVVFYRSARDRPIRILYSLENGTRPFDFS